MQHRSLSRVLVPALLAVLLCLPAISSPGTDAPAPRPSTRASAPPQPRPFPDVPPPSPSPEPIQSPPTSPSPSPALPPAAPRTTKSAFFLVPPYLQLGTAPQARDLELRWETPDASADWSVQVRGRTHEPWRAPVLPSVRLMNVPQHAPYRVYRASLLDLPAGGSFHYRVLRNGTVVFSSYGRGRRTARQPGRFVVFGDAAEGTPAQKKIASLTYRQDPDYVFITGDVVYPDGRLSDYRRDFFPIYNADRDDPSVGAPLMRSVVMATVVGNHDTAGTRRDLARFPDGLAWFFVWSHPLNGPTPSATSAQTPNEPVPLGSPEHRRGFMASAGDTYPRMCNYSFEYGNAHWTVLDGDDYMDWSDERLRDWVRKDLSSAAPGLWRFVAVHQAPFHSSKEHPTEQRMRLLCDIFQEQRVAIVFSGHVHDYERTYPLVFRATTPKTDAAGRVDGSIDVDRTYDGVRETRPKGIVYVLSGAGGAALDDMSVETRSAWMKGYTARMVTNKHSLTVVDANEASLTCRQVAEDGAEVDRFVLTR